MSLRSRLSRWLAPEPTALLERYERALHPGLLDLFERAGGMTSGGASPIELTPTSFGTMGYRPWADPDPASLIDGSLSTADMAARAISNRMGELTPQLKRKIRVSVGTIKEEIIDDSPAQAVLDAPHPSFTFGQMMLTSTKQLLQTGESYWLKVRNGFGMPVQFQMLPTEQAAPIVEKGVVTGYVVLDAQGIRHVYPENEMLRFWIPDPRLLYSAKGYLGANWQNHKASVFAEQHLSAFYERDATPSIYLQGKDGAQAPSDPVRRAFEMLWTANHHRRLGSTRAPAFIPPLWEVKELNVQKGAEIVPLLDWWMHHQLINYGVPLSILGRVVSGDRSSAETNQFVFDLHTVGPIARIFSETLTRGFVREFDPSLFLTFHGFVTRDKEFELKQETADTTNKVRSPQQILRDRGSDEMDAPWGEFPVGRTGEAPYTGEMPPEPLGVPGELGDAGPGAGGQEAPVGDAGTVGLEGKSGSGPTRARIELALAWQRTASRRRKWTVPATAAAKRVFKAQRAKVLAALQGQRGARQGSMSEILDAIDGDLWTIDFEPVRRDAYADSGQEALDTVGSPRTFSFTGHVEQKLKQYGAQLIKNVDQTTRGKLRDQLVEAGAAGESTGQIEKRIKSVFDVRDAQATAIARTEMLRATEDAQVEGFAQSGVVDGKKWNDSQDDRVRDSHHEEGIEPVPLEDSFTLDNGRMARFPGDPNLPAEDVVNCRCFVTPELVMGGE